MTFIIIKSASRQYMQRHKEKFPNGVNQIIFRSNNLDSAREFLLNILNGLCHVEFADWAEAKKRPRSCILELTDGEIILHDGKVYYQIWEEGEHKPYLYKKFEDLTKQNKED